MNIVAQGAPYRRVHALQPCGGFLRDLSRHPQKKNKDIYLRTLLILLKALGVTPAEFFSDPMFTSEELDIDFR